MCPNLPVAPSRQVAEQQGKYLARVLNTSAAQLDPAEPAPFQYRHMGSMASLGEWGCMCRMLWPW